MIVFGKIILFLCILVIKRKFGRKSTEVLGEIEWLKFLFCPIFTIVTIAAMIVTFPYVANQMQANVLYTVAFGMVGINIFVYYLINEIVERETKLHEKEILELQVKNQMELYQSISDNYERQKHKTHEFKNHILCIQGLLKEKEYGELKQYVNKISEEICQERNAINTNHVIINAILNAKYQEAIKKQIVFVFCVNDLSGIKIEDKDLVVLLSNLLNNGIESCEKCNDTKVIKIKFMLEKDSIILSVRNTCNHTLVIENNVIKTTKTDMPKEHGVGIKNIIQIVEKYNGSYVIENKRGEFYFSILFPL